MIISVVSPQSDNNGNTVSSILLGLGLGDLKRKVLLTHVRPQSIAFDHYLGLKAFEDKTSTPTQLVKLMREGAVQPEDIGDYCKTFEDYLDVFTNKETNFSEQDMATLLDFLTTSASHYDYQIYDIDERCDHATSEMVLSKSNIIILNIAANIVDLDKLNAIKDRVAKICKGKKVILLCTAYDNKAYKSTKEIAKYLDMDTTVYVIRQNPWIRYGCNTGKLAHVYKQGKIKDADVVEVYKDVSSLATAVAKTKIAIGKAAKGVFK